VERPLVKTCTKCGLAKPLNEFGRNSQNVGCGLRPDCKDCKAARDKAQYERQREERKARRLQYYAENRAKERQKQQEYYQRNPYLFTEYAKARRAGLTKATPAWVDRKAMSLFYKNCPKGYHVDHIVPLRGKNVCGLHVPVNLQYLPAAENLRKNNKFEDEHGKAA
jgi:hypothetical protein